MSYWKQFDWKAVVESEFKAFVTGVALALSGNVFNVFNIGDWKAALLGGMAMVVRTAFILFWPTPPVHVRAVRRSKLMHPQGDKYR